VAVFLMLMLMDDRAGSVYAAAAAGAHRQLHLYLAQGASTFVNGATDLSIGNAMANADVHSDPRNLTPRR
jgi:hypothetical protein